MHSRQTHQSSASPERFERIENKKPSNNLYLQVTKDSFERKHRNRAAEEEPVDIDEYIILVANQFNNRYILLL